MAALMRSVLRCSRLTAVQVSGNIQVRRDVRALRRRPVQVIPPGKELQKERGPQTQKDRAQTREKSNDKARSQELQRHQPGNGELRRHQPDIRELRRHQPGNEELRRHQPDIRELRRHQPGSEELRRHQPGSEDKRQKDRAEQQKVVQFDSVELKYERALPKDNRLGKVVSIAKSKSFRDRHGQVLLEGQRLLLDAMEAGAVLHTLFFTRVDQLKAFPSDKLKKASLVKVKFQDVSMWSDVVAPQGVIGIFRKPDYVNMQFPETQIKNTLPLSLICDNIRDPGNLGTILRSAVGAGCNKVLLTKGCVDAWEPKVIRAGMGAHFRLPIITSLDWDTIHNYLPNNTKVFVADHTCEGAPAEEEFTSNKAIDYGWISNDPKNIRLIEGEDNYASSYEDEVQDIPKIPVQHYHEQWAKGLSALVIGGETHGLSIESLLLAENTGGRRLYIPVVPGMESLNSAMAASILLFEGRRQLLLKST